MSISSNFCRIEKKTYQLINSSTQLPHKENKEHTHIYKNKTSPFHARQCKTKGQACKDMGQMRVLAANLCIHNKTSTTVRVHEMFVKIPCSQTSPQNPAASVPQPDPAATVHTQGIVLPQFEHCN
jgi:hypothetical protein